MAAATIPAYTQGTLQILGLHYGQPQRCALYTGMTGFVDTRIFHHKSDEMDGFTKKYTCDRLVTIGINYGARFSPLT
ncbi:MAG TPA: hypothetical protein VFR24_27820 [Candidatus Angelobacter sp.]|nr:hypothetical protein [Candidatus Angelobacter sp.]